MKSEWADHAVVQHSAGTYQEMNSHSTCKGALDQSSQLAKPLWTDPGIESGMCVQANLYSPPSPQKKTENKAQAGIERSNILPTILASEEKATTNWF